MFRVLMNSRFLLPILVMAALLAGCAEPRNPEAIARARLISGSFASYGTVAFHQGQPCASQIMYDFRRRRSDNPRALRGEIDRLAGRADARNETTHRSREL